MMEKKNLEEIDFDFLNKDKKSKKKLREKYKIIIADDEKEVHKITKMMLKDFEFEGKGIKFIDTYNGQDTIEALRENPDTAILFLDVVMEEKDAGLNVVENLRKELNNHMTRVVLRTGHPGEAPEEWVIREYDINDYRLKTELTLKRLYTTVYTALRNYRDLSKIHNHKRGLEKIIKASSSLFENNSLDDFLESLLDNLSAFYYDESNIVYIRENDKNIKNGFITINEENENILVAASGKYTKYIGESLCEVKGLKSVKEFISKNNSTKNNIENLDNGIIISHRGKSNFKNYIFIEGKNKKYDIDLIDLFLSNYSVALDNYMLNNAIYDTQKELIITLGEVAENHFEETAGHVRRMSEMMYNFASKLNFSHGECQKLKIASTMHDIGKIGVPDKILKKKGKLTDKEFEIIKKHPVIGHNILSNSDLEILELSAELALNHHEKFDGSGYPNGLKGEDIPLTSRMLAIIDVFDAMSHKRVYKDALEKDKVLEYIVSQKGIHFDSELVESFINNFDDIVNFKKS